LSVRNDHPYIRDLHRAGYPAERVARFMARTEDADDVPLQVVETTGVAGLQGAPVVAQTADLCYKVRASVNDQRTLAIGEQQRQIRHEPGCTK
jgi:hypothetical protein